MTLQYKQMLISYILERQNACSFFSFSNQERAAREMPQTNTAATTPTARGSNISVRASTTKAKRPWILPN